MADREGFEPSVTLLLHTLSKRAHSTTLTPALGGRDARNSIRSWQPLFEIFGNQLPESVLFDPCEDPQQIRKAVKKQPNDFGNRLAGLVQGEHAAFSAAGHSS